MTGTDAACLHTNQSRSYLNHIVIYTHVYIYIYIYTHTHNLDTIEKLVGQKKQLKKLGQQ